MYISPIYSRFVKLTSIIDRQQHGDHEVRPRRPVYMCVYIYRYIYIYTHRYRYRYRYR